MGRIYTRTGDQGMTANYAGERIPKDDKAIVIAGLLDSFQAAIDLAISFLGIDQLQLHIKQDLQNIQDRLWQMAGELSLCSLGKNVKQPITGEDVAMLERIIDSLGDTPEKFVRFTLHAAAFLNEARVRCRALESALTPLLREHKIRQDVYQYLNRLSDTLFMMAYAVQTATR
ncbi:MAG: ATP:cob(I)alamin adenosyltransferase [archaeon]